MSALQPIPFLRHPVIQNHRLTESVCTDCGAFVGASLDQSNLLIAEAAHRCPDVIESGISNDKILPQGLV
jgi:hypothetical protein